jgi:hypothetical protein
MHKTDMRSETTTALAIAATLTGTTASAGNIARVGDYGAVTLALQTHTVTVAGTAGFGFEIQESDTTAAADFAAVADRDLIGLESALTVTLDTADNVPIGNIGYKGTKEYVRVVATGTTNTNAVVSGVWILQKPRYSPKGDVAANIAAT